MNRFVILALCVSLWASLSRSQIIFSRSDGEMIMDKLDSLDYLRAGVKIDSSTIATLQEKKSVDSAGIVRRDSIINEQGKTSRLFAEKANKAERRASVWKYIAVGWFSCSITLALLLALGK